MKGAASTLYRFLVPLGLAGVAVWLHLRNADAAQVIAFSFVDDLFPSTRGDPQAMGRVTVWIVAGLAGASAAWNGWRELQHREARGRLRK